MPTKFKLDGPTPYLLLAALYFISGKLALHLAFLQPSATPVWSCTGIDLAAVRLFGYRLWPRIFVASFFVNLATAGTVLTSFSIATGNTLEALAGCFLVSRFADGSNVFQRSQNIFRFALFAGIIASAIGASVGSATLVLGGLADLSHYPSIWMTWWLGDGVGALVLTPRLLRWVENRRLAWTRRQSGGLARRLVGLAATRWALPCSG